MRSLYSVLVPFRPKQNAKNQTRPAAKNPPIKLSKTDKRLVKVYLTKDGELLQNRIEEKIDFLGNKIESQFSYDKKEDIINNLSSFQWVIKKLFLTKK